MRIFLYLITCLSIIASHHVEGALSDIPYTLDQENNVCADIEIDSQIKDRYQAVAKFINNESDDMLKPRSNTIQTNIVTYETTSLGVHLHCAWYSDGYVATALNGTEQGKQIVFVNGSIVSISYDIDFYNNYYSHKHAFGVVYSYTNMQITVFK